MPSAKRRKIEQDNDEQVPGDDLELSDHNLQSIAQNALANSIEVAEAADAAEAAIGTPSKRGRGRPKGAKNRRTPTPEGDIPPEERFFFQTRVGPANQQPSSTNSFAALGLLTHEQYLAEARKFKDSHDLEMRYLLKLHARAFPQWQLELEQSYSLCLYGWGSKRQLITNFADYLCRQATKRGKPHPKIVVVNGYAHKLTIRLLLNTVATVLNSSPQDRDEDIVPARLVGQPQEILDTLLARLDSSAQQVFLMINSLDHPSSALRSLNIQSLLARLSAHSKISTIFTCDTPTHNLLFPSNIRDQYNLIFHDATTFAAYDAETNPVDDVNELLGRKGRRIGGGQGVSFVLKSLPENARNLYRLLLSEILTLLDDDEADMGANGTMADDFIDPTLLDVAPTRTKRLNHGQTREDVGIEYRTLYQKATEEFICSSDMNFRFLLKEFHDHQMLVTRKDASGTEVICLPLDRSEMESVLEELVL